MPALRLFKVNDGKTPIYFDSKRAAKAKRDKFREEGKEAHVMYGPDHWKGESYGPGKGSDG